MLLSQLNLLNSLMAVSPNERLKCFVLLLGGISLWLNKLPVCHSSSAPTTLPCPVHDSPFDPILSHPSTPFIPLSLTFFLSQLSISHPIFLFYVNRAHHASPHNPLFIIPQYYTLVTCSISGQLPTHPGKESLIIPSEALTAGHQKPATVISTAILTKLEKPLSSQCMKHFLGKQ